MAHGDSMPEFMYHYTNKAGADAIRSSGHIQVSTDTRMDALLGVGVYLTALPPTENDAKLTSNNYGAPDGEINNEKVQYCFKIPTDKLAHLTKDDERSVYMLKKPLQLRFVPYMLLKRSDNGRVVETIEFKIDSMPEFMYYYTNEAGGSDAIKATEYIEVSNSNGEVGVYLTTLAPNENDATLTGNNFGAPDGGMNNETVHYCFRILTARLPELSQNTVLPKSIHMFKGRLELRLVPYTILRRSNNGQDVKVIYVKDYYIDDDMVYNELLKLHSRRKV